MQNAVESSIPGRFPDVTSRGRIDGGGLDRAARILQEGQGRSMVTRKEVARLAGVSEATVSHVINKSKAVSPELTERVQCVVRDTKYRPNRIAQSLVTKVGKHVAIIVEDIKNTYYSEIAEGMSEVAWKEGYIVSLIGLNYTNEEMLWDLISRNIDGVFITVAYDRLRRVFEEYRKAGIALVGVDGCSVELDYERSVDHMIKYLADLGHRKIGLLSGLPFSGVHTRYTSYVKSMRRYGLQPDASLIVEGAYPFHTEFQDGYRAMNVLLRRKTGATAVFVVNDMMALGAIKAIREAGMTVPGDISVVGCDDIFFASCVDPPLSTISAPKKEIGRRAMYCLLDQIHGKPGEDIVLGTEFVVRSSTGPAKK